MIPPKLQTGDEIRVIAPSCSLAIISKETSDLATQRLSDLGYRVTFGEHVEERDAFDSSSIASRVADLHAAFQDPNVKAILTVLGGYNCNQLLRHLDYDLIRQHPKILCGYSDITALQHAILRQAGLVTYSGPHWSTFGCLKGIEYTLDSFQRCLTSESPIEVRHSPNWSDDAWYLDQQNRTFFPNEGTVVLQEGEASGTILGANLCTLNLLQGTAFMPTLAGSLLFLEDDYESHAVTFDRDLQSLLHQPGFDKVMGLVIGRFQQASSVSLKTLRLIIASKKELRHLPVVANFDFGHTQPMFTFPIGGEATLKARSPQATLTITRH